MHQRKLSNILIYPKFQLALLAANLLICFITVTAMYWKVSETFQRLNGIGSKLDLPPDDVYFKFIESSERMLQKGLLGSFLISFFLTTIVTLVLSHRMVGPIYKLRKYLKGLIAGEQRYDLKFRKGDFFEDIPDALNEVLSKNLNKD